MELAICNFFEENYIPPHPPTHLALKFVSLKDGLAVNVHAHIFILQGNTSITSSSMFPTCSSPVDEKNTLGLSPERSSLRKNRLACS